MKTLKLLGKTNKSLKIIFLNILFASFLVFASCSNDAECELIITTNLRSCTGYITNGDFEIVTGDPNLATHEDINLATGWKALWTGTTSLADLYDNSTTVFNDMNFLAPIPSSGVYAAMFIENSTDASPTYREGMFNELNAVVLPSSGLYSLSFNYANMSGYSPSNDVKVGVYGIFFPAGTPLPPRPTSMILPSNLDHFGAANTVFLGEIIIDATVTNTWEVANLLIDTNILPIPASGFDHIMITNSHLLFPHWGRKYVAFDNFCLINN